jgi:hypothetical protein
MFARAFLARYAPRIAIGYVVALIAVVAGTLVYPFSSLWLGALFLLIGEFGLFALFVIMLSYMRIIYAVAFPPLLRMRLHCSRVNRLSKASDPGLVPLSLERLRRFHPELFVRRANPFAWLDRVLGVRAAVLYRVRDQLLHGDSRAAVVVSLEPLVVAAYTDEIDCVALLRFPDEFVEQYNLRLRSRLLTVNRYLVGETPAPDLVPGPLSYHRCANVIPYVADFLTDDADRLRDRKREIRNDEWTRAWVLGQAALQRPGAQPRDGRPLSCGTPAAAGDENS